MSEPRPSQPGSVPGNYAGDLTAKETWELLAQEAQGQLIDVRTVAEWNFVGVPDMSALKRETIYCEWQHFPPGPNPHFLAEVVAALEQTNYRKGAPLAFLCRSGARSRAAAIAMTAAGYGPCFNVKDGFEGALDAQNHRGQAAGWKAAGLPWLQS